MLARGCGCIVPADHLVLTRGDVIVHSGQGAQSILSGKMRKWLFSTMDSTNFARAFVVSNPSYSEAWICFPTANSTTCNRALIWNWNDNTFTVRELDRVTYGCSGVFAFSVDGTWAGDSGSWDSDATTWSQSEMTASQAGIILCSTAPSILSVDTGTDFHGTAFTSKVERTGLSVGVPDRVKTIRSVFPRIDGATGQTVYIQVGGAMDVEGPYEWSSPVPYVIGETYRADSFASGRFLGFRIYSSGSFLWRIRSIDIDLVQRGTY